MDKALIDKISDRIYAGYLPMSKAMCRIKAEDVAELIKEAGYVKLAEDQSHGGSKELIYAIQHGFRRVEL